MSILNNLSSLDVTLRDYQIEMIEAIHNCHSNNILAVKPTGTGKTFTVGSYCLITPGRTLWIACSEELIDQTVDSFKTLMPGVDIGVFIGSNRNFDNHITIASLQTIKNPNNLILLSNEYKKVVFDEAHHAVAPTAKRAFYKYGLVDLDTAGFDNVRFFRPHFSDDRKLIGCTATSERTDGTPLGNIFQDRVDAPRIEWFINQGYLCDLKFLSVETGIDLSDVKVYAGDLSESGIADHLVDSGYIKELGRVIEEYCGNRKSIIVYLPNVVTTKLASKLLNESGISSDYVIGAERQRRKEVIARFKKGEFRVLVNCLVLKEGFDAPNADAMLLCRPTRSSLLLTQMIGRLTRNSPQTGKDYGLIVDLVFRRRQEDILSASSIFEEYDLKDPEIEKMSIRERYELQVKRANLVHKVLYIIDRFRHNKTLMEQKEEENKEKKVRYAKDPEYVDMPDSIQLLVDTRILKKLDMTYKEFMSEFKNQVYILSNAQDSIFNFNEIGDKQSERLQDLTGYSAEDLSIMDWVDAQALISVFACQKPITSNQINYLYYIYGKQGLEKEEVEKLIPKTSKKAHELICELTGVKRSKGRRIKYGRA